MRPRHSSASANDGHQHKDWFLLSLVNIANQGIPMAITVHVSSLIITGTLISGTRYFSLMGKYFSKDIQDEAVAKGLEETYRVYGEIYHQADANAHMDPSFLHLEHARFYGPDNQQIPCGDETFLWRGRLSDISGFSLGALGSKP